MRHRFRDFGMLLSKEPGYEISFHMRFLYISLSHSNTLADTNIIIQDRNGVKALEAAKA
jgi:hypothetical protein